MASVNPDKRLVDRCLAGEPKAWDRFVEQYGPFLAWKVRGTLLRFGRKPEPDLVQDLLQEVFLSLLENRCASLRHFRWNSSLRHYLAMVVVARVATVLKRKRLSRPAGEEEAAAWERFAAEREEGPPPAVELREIVEKVHEALPGLPARERLVFQFYYGENLSLETIARMLSIQGDSARVLLSRARQRLRELLKGRFCW